MLTNRPVTYLSIILLFLTACKEVPEPSTSYSEEPVNQPVPFAPGLVSTDAEDEFDITFSPDGKTIFFTRRKEGEKQKIYTSRLESGKWTKPVVASFSTDRDETPSLMPDGRTLYFGSQREIPGKPNRGGFDMNVWKVVHDGKRWGEPEPLPEPINYVQEEGENWPSSNNNFFFSLNGKDYLFTSMVRGSEAIDIYTTTDGENGFTAPQRIAGLFDDESLWKYSASLSPDGNYLIFNSYSAPGGFGGEDLYVSRKTEAGWSKAMNMGSLVNSEGEESSGRFTPDGKYFFFTHADNLGNDNYGSWDLYFIETEFLKLERLFQNN